MTTAVAPRPTGRGRQSVEVERQRDAELEAIAHQREDLVFADRVRRGAARLRTAIVLERFDMVDQVAGELGYHADRRARQLGSGVL